VVVDEICREVGDNWESAASAEGIAFSSTSEDAELRATAIRLVGAYIEKMGSEKSVPLAVETAIESPLVDPRTGEDLGIPLVGVLDLVLEEPDGPVIVDFKTAARADHAPAQLHEIQLGCYAYLFRQSTGQSENALEIRRLIKTRTPQIICERRDARTESHLGRLFAVVRAYLDDLECGRFVYRPGLGCNYCDFQADHCDDWTGEFDSHRGFR
jgi:hypothetical protein